MKFKVHGADADTGHDLAVELHAPTVTSARAQAFRMGMLVSRVEALEDPEIPADLGAPPTSPAEIAPPTRTPTIAPTVIERTSKKWKTVQLAGGIIFAAGIVFIFMAVAMRQSGDTVVGDLASIVGFLAIIAGPCVWLYGRISAWWHHG